MRNLVLGTLVVLGACGPSERTGNGNGSPDAGQTTGDSTQGGPTSRVYAHSGDMLYRVDTQTFAPVQIGAMTGLGSQSLTDLAIDKSDNMYGITRDTIYTIDPNTGDAAFVALVEGDPFITSLSFIPEDLDNNASGDILVSANSDGQVFRIELDGATSVLGDFGMDGSDPIGSSGDLIGVRGFGIYATVNIGTNPDSEDYLARINPDTWVATPIGGGTGYNDIFGLAYWEGKIYGFVSNESSGAGKIITIDPGTGAGTEVQTGSVPWYGAGVATDAPILQ